MQDTLRYDNNSDTILVCTRNPVADVTFHDSLSFIHALNPSIAGSFPFTFTTINREKYLRERELLFKTLKEGEDLPSKPYIEDWMVPALLFAAFLFALVRTFPGNFFNSMIRYLTMRGINENSSRDTAVLFQWQSTILNLAAFISVSLFGYLLIAHFGIAAGNLPRFITWLICLGIVITAVTLRHFICNITGNISGEVEVFREYLIGIYHTYRAAGIIFLLISVIVLYTTFFSVSVWFTAGIIVAGILYIIRIIRLFLIFMTRHVSILYLILYLCALEILPVVIIVKYVTGLV